LWPTAAAICLTLTDFETPIWLDSPLQASTDVCEYLTFQCGCQIVTDPAEAQFAIIADGLHLPSLATFSVGCAEYPDRSTTVIIQIDSIDDTAGAALTGPGIATPKSLSLRGVREDFFEDLTRNNRIFPLGVDVLCVTETAVIGLPRTVKPESG
jgi:alpha-D-ribose 1-methylphosphonate 5-triphosphate synthase subunit PhnH